MKYTLITILVFCLVMQGCKDRIEDSQVITVDLTGKPDVTKFNLNDYVTDLKLIRLEANDSSLIRRFSGYVGEKYVISMEREKVLLFNSDGEFLQTIARRGKGPNEFTQIDVWVVDENENFFLFHDDRKSYIFKYNLNNQQPEENIQFEEHGSLSRMVLINDTTLSILPGMFSEYGYLFFNQTLNGQITGGIAKENVPHPGAWAGTSPVFKKSFDNWLIYQPSESDTVFRIDGTKIFPAYLFLVEKPQKSGDVTTGTSASYVNSDKNLLFIAKTEYESTVSPMNASINITGGEFIVVDLKTLESSKIDTFSLEFMDMELAVPGVSFPDKNRIVIVYQAVAFKKEIDKALNREDIAAGKKERLMQLNSEISENDNPIIISGRWK